MVLPLKRIVATHHCIHSLPSLTIVAHIITCRLINIPPIDHMNRRTTAWSALYITHESPTPQVAVSVIIAPTGAIWSFSLLELWHPPATPPVATPRLYPPKTVPSWTTSNASRTNSGANAGLKSRGIRGTWQSSSSRPRTHTRRSQSSRPLLGASHHSRMVIRICVYALHVWVVLSV